MLQIGSAVNGREIHVVSISKTVEVKQGRAGVGVRASMYPRSAGFEALKRVGQSPRDVRRVVHHAKGIDKKAELKGEVENVGSTWVALRGCNTLSRE